MGIIDFLKKRIRDKDLCFLRDLYCIAFVNDGPFIQDKTKEIIAEMTESISEEKKSNFLSIDPERIADIYPEDYKDRERYLFSLFYLWKFSGNHNKDKSYDYIRNVSKKMGLSSSVFATTYDIIRDYDPRMFDDL